MVEQWTYLVVEVSNSGRTITENGKLAKGHTKKPDLSALPKSQWNDKGKKMNAESKGDLLDGYGSKGWELVSTQFGTDSDNKYIFKKKN